MAQVMDTYMRSSPALNLMSDVYVQVREAEKRNGKRNMETQKKGGSRLR